MFSIITQLFCNHDWLVKKYDVSITYRSRDTQQVWKEDFDTYVIKFCRNCGHTKRFHLWGVMKD